MAVGVVPGVWSQRVKTVVSSGGVSYVLSLGVGKQRNVEETQVDRQLLILLSPAGYTLHTACCVVPITYYILQTSTSTIVTTRTSTRVLVLAPVLVLVRVQSCY